MKPLYILFIVFFPHSCTNFGQLTIITNLPNTLKEVSGTETTLNSDLIWMLNDSGNTSEIYGVNSKGNLKKTIKINAKNYDWEDLTSDNQGNLYIGDFGNNESKRKNLVILKVNASDLDTDKKIEIERISFTYPNQKKFPSNKKNRFFDAESFFWHNNNLYIFTKSRVKNKFGKTSLYKIPASRGNHVAEYLGSFNSCDDLSCWITSADINANGTKLALLNNKSVWLFTDFVDDNFLDGKATEYKLNHTSQKEGICFKDDETLYITDEKSHGKGGNLYEFSLVESEKLED